MSSHGTIILHSGGDSLRLILGEEKRSVVVSRLILTMLSPVFKAMVMGSFREGSPDTVEIPFPDDDPDSILILLRIGHLKFKDLPKTLSFQELYKLSIVCDKYDIIGPVRPFLKEYTAPYIGFVSEPGYEEWMFISWTFGLEDIYVEVTNALINQSILKDGELWRNGRLIEDLLPLGANEIIVERRHDKLDSWVQALNGYFDLLCDKGDRCAIQRLGHMTWKLSALFSFYAKASAVTELDHVAIFTISGELDTIIPDHCGDPCLSSLGSHSCRKKSSGRFDSGYYARRFAYGKLAADVLLPDNVMERLKIQAAK